MKEKKPTASTRSNEDFPAFWSPIIVTSISVALHLPDHHMALFLAHLKPQLFFFFFQARIIQNLAILRGTARGMEGYFICGRKQHHDKLAHLPEHPQKPVINGTKDSSHGDGLYPRRRERDQERNKGEYICF